MTSGLICCVCPCNWLNGCCNSQVALLGMEQPSVASVRPENRQELTDVHRALLQGGVVIVEGLCNLDQLKQEQVQFVALPLRLRDCDGSPVRAIAIEKSSGGVS